MANNIKISYDFARAMVTKSRNLLVDAGIFHVHVYVNALVFRFEPPADELFNCIDTNTPIWGAVGDNAPGAYYSPDAAMIPTDASLTQQQDNIARSFKWESSNVGGYGTVGDGNDMVLSIGNAAFVPGDTLTVTSFKVVYPE